MQQESKIKKIILWTIVAVVILFLIWFLFFRNAEPQVTEVDEFGNPIKAQALGQDLVDLLSDLQGVELDQSVLRSPGFMNLNDFSVQLPDLPKGKNNPFAKF